MRERRFQAFTLIEIMVVVAIIAILLGVLVPHFARARSEAKLESCKRNLLLIADAVEVARIRHPNYFHYQHGDDRNNTITIDEHCLLVEEGYLSKVPRCPSCNGQYGISAGIGWGRVGNNVQFYIQHSYVDAHNELGIPKGYPMYEEYNGIIEKP